MSSFRLLALGLCAASAAPALAQPPADLALPAAAQTPVAEPPDAALLAAEAPDSFSFQGVLSDGGQPVADGTYGGQVRLFDVATGGTALYAEDHSVATTGGVFALSVGGGTVASGSFASVNFSEAVWIETVWAGTTLGPRTAVEPSPVARTLVAGATVEGDGQWALRGESTSTLGEHSGVLGRSTSTQGRGVFGRASATSGLTYGVYGWSESPAGRGVFGVATAANGTTNGVHGENASTEGRGVYGSAFSPSGTTYGVYGRSVSTSGRGVFGEATASSGTTFGGRFESQSTSGRGVFGEATATSGFTYGGHFESGSTEGRGVYGSATAPSGSTYGVWGQSASFSGRGVYGEATAQSGSTYGVWGRSASFSGRGVYGLAAATGGTTYGVYGLVASPNGYGGYFEGGRGVGISISPDFGSVAGAARLNDDLMVEANDAVAGLYSGGGGVWGSALVFAEVGGGGGLVNKWGIVRRTGASGGLYFTFGTDAGYATNDAQMRIDTDGSVHADGSFVGGGADLAEYFPLADPASGLAPGQVVGLTAGRVSLTTEGAEQVAVISSDPAFIGNPDGETGGVLIALVGQTAVRLATSAAEARPGDLLVASGHQDGTARAVALSAYAPASDGPVLGRVLRVTEVGEAVALVGVDEAAALRAVVARQQNLLGQQQRQIDALAADRDRQVVRLDALQDQIEALVRGLGAREGQLGAQPDPAVAARY